MIVGLILSFPQKVRDGCELENMYFLDFQGKSLTATAFYIFLFHLKKEKNSVRFDLWNPVCINTCKALIMRMS